MFVYGLASGNGDMPWFTLIVVAAVPTFNKDFCTITRKSKKAVRRSLSEQPDHYHFGRLFQAYKINISPRIVRYNNVWCEPVAF